MSFSTHLFAPSNAKSQYIKLILTFQLADPVIISNLEYQIYHVNLKTATFFLTRPCVPGDRFLLSGVGMDVAALRERLAEAEQSHVLDFWDDLSEDERKALYEDVAGLDLAELNEDFLRMSVKAESDAAGGKMDDHMQPLPADQCGSVLKATEEVSAGCITRFVNGLRYFSPSEAVYNSMLATYSAFGQDGDFSERGNR